MDDKKEAHNEIMIFLGRLDGKVDGINQRLDTVNGRLGKHDKGIESLNLTRATQAGSQKVIALIWNTLVATAVSYLTVYWTNKK